MVLIKWSVIMWLVTINMSCAKEVEKNGFAKEWVGKYSVIWEGKYPNVKIVKVILAEKGIKETVGRLIGKKKLDDMIKNDGRYTVGSVYYQKGFLIFSHNQSLKVFDNTGHWLFVINQNKKDIQIYVKEEKKDLVVLKSREDLRLPRGVLPYLKKNYRHVFAKDDWWWVIKDKKD